MAELLERKKRSMFYGWPMAIFLAGMLVFAIHASSHMVAAGDTWVAMACGRHHANHGVDTVEPFSANSHKAGPTEESIKKWPGWAQKLAKPFDIETIRKWHPTGWVNQNWLTHTTFYWLAKTFGSDGEYNYNALIYWKFAIYIIEVLCVYFIARLLGVSVPGSAAAAAFALYVGRTFLDVRPAGYANLLSVIFLLVIVLSVYRNMRYIWLLVPLTVFWSNVHGGYIYVFIMMVPFIGVHFLANLPKKLTLGLFCIGAWSFLYLLSYKFISHDTYRIIHKASGNLYTAPGIFSDKIFRILTLLIVITVVLAVLKNIKPAALYVYSLIASLVFGLLLLGRMSIALPANRNPSFMKIARDFLWDAQSSFYFFLIFLLFVGIAVTFRKKNLVLVKSKAIVQSVVAVAVAFVAMVLFNPYHLTNLTHTFEISVSEHAESWRIVSEWHPAFEWDNKVGDEIPFLIMYIIAWIAFAVWFGVRFIRPRVMAKRRGQMGEYAEGSYEWPKIDIAIITIVVMSIYMAIESRRFIPMAATAACPFIALFFEQAVGMFLARIQYSKTKTLQLPVFGPTWRNGIIAGAGIIVLSFGFVWGAKYKRIYLDPWPRDDIRNSVFMRMTASNVKPFDVSTFIRENELNGRMFNYWTEGGALAFGQEPDVETGKTPLQLFMDGRAQAAYNHDKFMEWRDVYAGGDSDSLATKVRRTRKIANKDEMREIGEHLTGIMKKDDIWVFVLPVKEFVVDYKEPWKNNYYPLALSRHPEWAIAYADNYQMLYVNIKMTKGKEVYQKLFARQLKFPTEMSENYTLAKHYLNDRRTKVRRKGFEMAKRAFELDESQGPMGQLANEAGRRWPELRKEVTEYITAYVTKFMDKKEELSKQGGYVKKLGAVRIGSSYLSSVYKKSNPKLSAEYKKMHGEISKEQKAEWENCIW
ncbi:MAG: hypothetical protein FVQ79_05225 [Planctomycetes bacterium]|nr:hypothetical protein [Planctomycetota bacterium]